MSKVPYWKFVLVGIFNCFLNPIGLDITFHVSEDWETYKGLKLERKRKADLYICPHGYSESNDCPDCRH